MSKYPSLIGALLVLSCMAPAQAQSSMADEAKALVKKAKSHIKANGVEKACADFTDPAAGFQPGELYVVVQDITEAGHLKVVCHAKVARMKGMDMIEQKDMQDGKYYNKELVDIAKSKGQGWIDYHWVNPVSKKIEPKSSYFEVQDGLVILSGFYKK